MMKTLHIGIAPESYVREQMLAVARGEVDVDPKKPKVWFSSLLAAAQVLNPENIRLLEIIADRKPGTIKALEELTGRKASNLSRTLKTLHKHGLVELVREKQNRLRPIAKATAFDIHIDPESWGTAS